MRVEVRYWGPIEVGAPRRGRPGYRWTNGYVVVVDGRELFPPAMLRDARANARQFKEG